MFPGKFDLAFSSHQLFHVCVVVAAAIHYKAIFQLLAWRDATGGPGGCEAESRLATSYASLVGTNKSAT